MSIEPDTKDWTWVLGERCAECGLAAGEVDPVDIPELVRACVPWWLEALDRQEATTRPDPSTWSVAEYACHVRDVRDVLDLFADRIERVMDEDDPQLANWDQDATAVADRYDLQLPERIAPALVAAADRAADAFARVPTDGWVRPARRSNGSVFTARTLAQYFWHDVAHHLHDVDARGPLRHETTGIQG